MRLPAFVPQNWNDVHKLFEYLRLRAPEFPTNVNARIMQGGANVSMNGANPSINSGVGVVSVSQVATGRVRVVLPFNVASFNDVWVGSQIHDNGPWTLTVSIAFIAPATIEFYSWSMASVLTDRTFSFTYLARAKG